MSTIFVISDLHMGGAEGFQMSSPRGRDLLADFIGWVASQHSASSDVRLVIAGDIVDFLAERDADGGFSSFTADEGSALGKLNRIVKSNAPVWNALGELCKTGAALTLMLGNHDIELSFPALRARMHSLLGGRTEFLYDNEAFAAGPLVIEHGNRYDGFNQVDHDALRRHRSHLSRREEVRDTFPAQPGSDLVSKVMNRIKEKYSFVDLLKPETSGVAPILAALDWRVWSKAGVVIEQAARAWYQGGSDSQSVPNHREFISARTAPESPLGINEPYPDEDAMALANEIAQGTATEKIGRVDDLRIDFLIRAFRKRREKDATTFKVTAEASTYLTAAEAAAKRGFGIVVMGHTHLVKRVPLGAGGVYLNTGTWADLICIPDAVYEGPEAAGRQALVTFLENIKSNQIDRYRRPVPTFAKIVLEGKDARSDIFFYDGGGVAAPVTDAGLLKRLGMGA